MKEAVERLKAADAKIGGVTVHLIRQGAGKDVAKAVVDLKAAAQVLAAEAEALLSELSRLSRLVEDAGEALEPFARAANRLLPSLLEKGVTISLNIRTQDLRRAAQAHKAIKEGGE